MSTGQKVIKYLAIAFAVYLIANITIGIFSVLYNVSMIFDDTNREIRSEDLKTTAFNELIDSIDMDIMSTKVVVKTGEELKVETNNNYINVKVNNSTLEIKEEDYFWFFNTSDLIVTIYIPKDINFQKVKIDAGAGQILINDLAAQNVSFDLGAGSMEIDNLRVTNDASMDVGAGELIVKNGDVNNLKMSIGAGSANVTTGILGNTKIDSGVGETVLNILSPIDYFKFEVDKGIGTVTVDGIKRADDSEFGTGSRLVSVDNGVGTVDINFK